MGMRIKYYRVKLLIMLLIALGFSNAPVALSADTQVLVSQVQVRKYSASDQLPHLHEAIVLKNDSEDDVDITNWCVYYASVSTDFSDGTKRKLGCFTPTDNTEKIFIKGGGIARFGSFEPDFFDHSIFYLPSFNQGLSDSKGKVLLLDGSTEKDRVEWGTHPNAFKINGQSAFGRRLNEQGILIYSGNSFNDFEIISQIDTTTEMSIHLKKDVCPNNDGFQLTGEECAVDPPEETIDEESPTTIGGESPVTIDKEPPATIDFLTVPRDHTLQIVEYFPNPPGSDIGNEFIEFFNYGNDILSLSQYGLSIEGPTLTSKKSFKLPDISIHPGEYISVYNTGAQNYALNNTKGKITLTFNNNVVDQANYNSTKEGYSWSLIGNDFVLSSPSPNAENILNDVVLIEKTGKVTELKPCATDQERNPATGRCRKIPVIAEPTPCKTGQERNPETGRCKNLATSKTPVPCKAGQERNPETGRCRNIKRASPPKTTDGVKALDTPESNTFWIWLVTGLALTAAFSYMIWEWREEIKQIIDRIINRIKTPKDDL